MPDQRSRRAVEVSERYADDLATKSELSKAQALAAVALDDARSQWAELEAQGRAGFTGVRPDERSVAKQRWIASRQAVRAAFAAKAVARPTDAPETVAEEMTQAADSALGAEIIGERSHQIGRITAHYTHLLRDFFGNPFRPVTAHPSWLTSTVVSLAEGIYAERAFDRLPILADALQDAGCENADILTHCRSDGPHVRGCWVVDLLLGKA
jgi:hypothetical protein